MDVLIRGKLTGCKALLVALLAALPVCGISGALAGTDIKLYPGDDAIKVVVIRPKGEHFEKVLLGLVENIEGDAEVKDIALTEFSRNDVMQVLNKSKPNVVILMGNSTINGYKKIHNEVSFEPVVLSVAAAFVDRVAMDIPKSVGILYEIPAVVGLSNLRGISAAPISRVGVIYRQQFGDLFDENKAFSEKEKFELIGVKLPSSPSLSDVKKALKELSKKKLDAIWVMNDSGLLKPEFMTNVWIPFFNKFEGSSVVGVSTLAMSKLNFGNFVVSPDHHDLGMQAAEMVFELEENDWEVLNPAFTKPISVKKFLNEKISDQRKIKLKENAIDNTDGSID